MKNFLETFFVIVKLYPVAQKMEGKGDEEDRGYDGRTARRKTWKEWERFGEQEQPTEGAGDCRQ